MVLPRYPGGTPGLACWKKVRRIALIRHFGSLKGLARASFQELRQFLPRRQAESVVAALSMSVTAETEHARPEQLDNPESIYLACADMMLALADNRNAELVPQAFRAIVSRNRDRQRRVPCPLVGR
jgi:hypothetical protein